MVSFYYKTLSSCPSWFWSSSNWRRGSMGIFPAHPIGPPRVTPFGGGIPLPDLTYGAYGQAYGVCWLVCTGNSVAAFLVGTRPLTNSSREKESFESYFLDSINLSPQSQSMIELPFYL